MEINFSRGNKMAKTRFETKCIKSALGKLQFSENTFYRAIAEFYN